MYSPGAHKPRRIDTVIAQCSLYEVLSFWPSSRYGGGVRGTVQFMRSWYSTQYTPTYVYVHVCRTSSFSSLYEEIGKYVGINGMM